MGYTQVNAESEDLGTPRRRARRGLRRSRFVGLQGITGGDFTGELRWIAPTPERTGVRSGSRAVQRTRCKGTSGGAASPEQLARFRPGGDLEHLLTAPLEVVGGNICLNGSETYSTVQPQYRDVAAQPGGWFLHHAGGGVSQVVNPPSEWGTPDTDASQGTVTLTGRKDDRTVPWALALDAETDRGSLYFEPTAPAQAADRTDVETLDPEGERVSELRAEQAAESARLQEELAARRRTAANGDDPESAESAESADLDVQRAGVGAREGGTPSMLPLAIGGLALLLLGRRRR